MQTSFHDDLYPQASSLYWTLMVSPISIYKKKCMIILHLIVQMFDHYFACTYTLRAKLAGILV